MSTATIARSATVKETAAALRKTLRETFPGTKFSVRMSSGTGYGWLRVEYTDGPTVESVREVTSRFESRRFDGMDDSYHETENQQWSCCGVNVSRLFSTQAVASIVPLVQYAWDGEPYVETDEAIVFARYPHTTADEMARTYLSRVAV